MVDRSRNQIQQGAVASQAARLPALPVVPSNADPAIRQFLEAVRERLEVREGSRGNPFEAVVTKRDLVSAGLLTVGGRSGSGEAGSVLVQMPDGSFVRRSIDEFAAGIYKLPLYQNLMKRLDDQSRFDRFPEEIKALLLNSIADEAAKRGADVREVEYKLQTAERSLAYKVEEVTAAVNATAAGVRETTFAVATDQRAQAGKVTQLEASLGNYYQDGTPGRAVLETEMLVTADRTAGLAAEYMVKINAGRAVAGFGLAASEDPSGDTTSAFIVQADQFALTSTYTFVQDATPTATAIGQTWYRPSTEVSYRSTGTGTGNWTVYTPVVPFGVDTTTGTVYINGQVRINSGGTLLQDITTGLDGQDAVGFAVKAEALAFQVSRAGTAAPTSVSFTHEAQNLSTSLRVRYTSSPAISGFNGTYYNLTDAPSLTYSAFASAVGTNNTATLTATLYNPAGNNTPFESGGTGFVESVTLLRLYEGSGAIAATMSNPTHTFTADAAGAVATYADSGTEIRVYEGTTELAYDGVGTAAGTWTVTSSVSGITRGSLTDSGAYLTVGSHSAMAGDAASITYTISGKDRLGNSFSFTAKQTFSKGKAGDDGAAGQRGSLTGYADAPSAAWSSLVALNAIETMLGVGLSGAFNGTTSAVLRIGDTVTLKFSGWAEARYWSGTYSATNTDANRNGWLKPGVIIDGNLLVNGTVSTTSLIAGQLTGFEINTNPGTGARLVLNEGGVGAGSGNNSLRGYDALNNLKTQLDAHQGYLFVSNSGSTFGVTATMSGSGTAIKGVVTGTTSGITSAGVWGSGNYGPGIRGDSLFDYGAVLTGNATKAPIRLIESSTKPTNADTGGLMVYNDGLGLRLCVALGGVWYKIDATYTAI